MSELFSGEPRFTEEEQRIIDAERAKVIAYEPTFEISDERLLEMHRIVQAAVQVGSRATIESEGN
jgi:hypothetical protein